MAGSPGGRCVWGIAKVKSQAQAVTPPIILSLDDSQSSHPTLGVIDDFTVVYSLFWICNSIGQLTYIQKLKHII